MYKKVTLSELCGIYFVVQILGKELFSVLREKWGSDLSALVDEKVVVPIPGDIAYEDLGVKDENMKREMLSNIDAVINLAATVNFDERYVSSLAYLYLILNVVPHKRHSFMKSLSFILTRYDIALGINTLGPKHILDFAKQCSKLKIFVHVSTGKFQSLNINRSMFVRFSDLITNKCVMCSLCMR